MPINFEQVPLDMGPSEAASSDTARIRYVDDNSLAQSHPSNPVGGFGLAFYGL